MNKFSPALAAALLLASAAASADSAAPSREAVIADLVAARSSGELAALQAERGVPVAVPAGAKAAAAALPRQAVLTVKPTELRSDERLADAQAGDRGENAARELGDFPAPIVRRSRALAQR